MGFKCTEKVYANVRTTSPSEQLVLAVLAHMADDETNQCFPAINTIAEKSRLDRATVIRLLGFLKQKGLLHWENRVGKKPNQRLSNLYTLTLPEKSPDADATPVAQRDYPRRPARLPPSPSATTPVAQRDPIIHITDIDHTRRRTEKENTPQGAFGSVSGGFKPKSIGDGDVLDSAVKDLTAPPDAADQSVGMLAKMDLAEYAVRVVKSESKKDWDTFSHYILWKGFDACREEIYRLESEIKAGELKNVNNLSAVLTGRLKALPPQKG